MNNISIVIPCRNEENFIHNCIDSLLKQNYSLGKIEILVVDGMSNDNTRQVIQNISDNDKRVVLINNPNRTIPHAMNIGIKNAKYDLILRMDAHAKVKDNFLENNIKALFENENIMCSGGKIENVFQNNLAERIGLAMSSKFGVGNATFRTGGDKAYVDTVAFGLFRKKIFELVGLYDENLIRNEDDDLSYRINKANFKILYDPIIVSEYFVRSSFKKLYNQYFQYGYWKVYVAKKHKTITTIRQLIPLLFVLGIILGGIISIFSKIVFILYILTIILYILMALFFGINKSKNMIKGIGVAIIFPVLHWSYGWGYLKGIIHFLLLNKKPSQKSQELTR